MVVQEVVPEKKLEARMDRTEKKADMVQAAALLERVKVQLQGPLEARFKPYMQGVAVAGAMQGQPLR